MAKQMFGTALTSASMGDIKPPQKPSEVEAQFSFVERERGSLDKRIAQLSDRLSPVLRPEPERGSEEKMEGLTPLADNIRKIGLEIRFFAGQIESILERLEL